MNSILPRPAPAFVAMLGLLVPATAGATWKRVDHVWARIVQHKDGTRTLSKQDVNTRTLEESTFDQNDIVVKRRMFQLDPLGRPLTGLIFDGQNNLLARTEYVYDDYEELKEERLFDVRGRILRRLVYGVAGGGGGGIRGGSGPPVAFTYDPENPEAAPVRSRSPADPVMPLDVKTGPGSGLGIPGGGGPSSPASIRSVEPARPGPAPAPATDGKRKFKFRRR